MSTVKFLIDHGALIDQCEANRNGESIGESALCGACYVGHMQVITYLVELGANVNSKRKDGASCLMAACAGCQVKVVKFLLENGARASDYSLTFNTPLHHASVRGSLEIVQFLVHAGADMTAPRIDGDTPLAAAQEKFPEAYECIKRRLRQVCLGLRHQKNYAHWGMLKWQGKSFGRL